MVGHDHDAHLGRQGVAQVLGRGVDHRQLLLPLGRVDAVPVPGPVEVAVVEVGQRRLLRGGGLRGGEPLPHPVRADELGAAAASHGQPGVAEVALVHHGRVHACGCEPRERRRVRLPLVRVDLAAPHQGVEQVVGARDPRSEPDDAVAARDQAGAERRQARGGRGGHTGRDRTVEVRGEERCLLGVVAQQLVAQPVDEEHDVAGRLGQREPRVGHPRVDAERVADRGQHVRERPPPVVGCDELRHRSVTGRRSIRCSPRARRRSPAGRPRPADPRPPH